MRHGFAASALLVILALAPAARAHPRELIGRPAPELRARPLDSDTEIDLSAHRGRVVLVVFYATWCGACRRMAPQLDALLNANRERGLDVLAFSNEPRDRLREHARVDPRDYARGQCTGRTSRRFHARALPTVFVIDREGIVRAAYQGVATDTLERLRRDIDRLLSAP